MASRVYNALGATPDDPCPTNGKQYCSLSDYRSWRESAALLFEQGIWPMWATLASAAPSIQTAPARALLGTRIQTYSEQFNDLPRTGSLFSSNDNLELVNRTMVLMAAGDDLIAELVDAIWKAGADAPLVPISTDPPPRKPKSSLRRYAWPAALGAGIVSVIGLTAWAAASMKGAADGRARNAS